MEPSPLKEREEMESYPFEGEGEDEMSSRQGRGENRGLSTFTIPIYFSP